MGMWTKPPVKAHISHHTRAEQLPSVEELAARLPGERQMAGADGPVCWKVRCTDCDVRATLSLQGTDLKPSKLPMLPPCEFTNNRQVLCVLVHCL
jgi:hypothetical protein